MGVAGLFRGRAAQLDTFNSAGVKLEKKKPSLKGRDRVRKKKKAHKCHCHSGCSCVNTNSEKVLREYNQSGARGAKGEDAALLFKLIPEGNMLGQN